MATVRCCLTWLCWCLLRIPSGIRSPSIRSFFTSFEVSSGVMRDTGFAGYGPLPDHEHSRCSSFQCIPLYTYVMLSYTYIAYILCKLVRIKLLCQVHKIKTLALRSADKSLTRPGRKQAQKHVRDARDFNKI